MSEPSTTPAVEVTDNPRADRYEARVGGVLAGIAQYVRSGGLIAFVHTEVEPEFEGRGVAGALARTSLDAARAEGSKVLASCPFYAGWIDRHPDYQDLLATEPG
ncbi:GNAT family N-acetyltransferase [Streptacidiphilus sp. P02-A3a]|uniref:GNAT family N-acetyltransferase n=1 Tax=Streptacidiphilus sp. P02-A3a TaxID=2704468 RepID=UPI0015FA06C6|nr:GNAT family N-acetyltransferase [Streptacidiphilus sp. P02-A3a]QMU70709.1 N-acetyltransferase [Streptacidiphilus sp. P02-A3a]